jgi:hypothetical protein
MTNPLLVTYDPKKVILTFGATPISGYSEDSMIEVAKSAEGFTRKEGADGAVVRSKKATDCHDVTITLDQTSLSNNVLSIQAALDKATGAGMLPLTITDVNSGAVKMWPQAWVEKPQSEGFAAEAGEREWVFHTGNIAKDDTFGIAA